jgi:hypothetical protein
MAGPVWRVFIPNEKKGATGSHYSVYAVNIPCASARSLVSRMVHKHSPGLGPSTSLLAGYTCLISNVPNGMLLFAGGCARGKFVQPMPTPDVKSFRWMPCYSTPRSATHKAGHPSCKWRPAYQSV